ncbi:hypothetical protein EJ04DRAFT_581201 [Polyplosphaeria fusca]|uniref:Uncharacterized protein n=1 Tax=Polyplosphaeria fusca TaxID=682080 RepID=A0A9P4QLP0_9PLEO|nr:hypothetical protein EJ04DRAFT_581201 [Polyplosphaeria fusca]
MSSSAEFNAEAVADDASLVPAIDQDPSTPATSSQLVTNRAAGLTFDSFTQEEHQRVAITLYEQRNDARQRVEELKSRVLYMETKEDVLQEKIRQLKEQLREAKLMRATKGNLQEENRKLKEQLSKLQAIKGSVVKASNLEWAIAKGIADLDLGMAQVKSYHCKHNTSTPAHQDGSAIDQYLAKDIGDKLFKEWKHDKEFLRKYDEARLEHVRHAHMHEGRGAKLSKHTNELIKIFKRNDQKRGAKTEYKV